MLESRQIHASCAARDDAGVLILGAPGAGKSDLLLRLLDRGFTLVADDRVILHGLHASPPPALAGLLELRGQGILKLPYHPGVTLRLVVQLGTGVRLPMRSRYDLLDLPMVSIDPQAASAPQRVGLALDAVQGNVSFLAGALEADVSIDAAGMGEGG